MKSISWVLLLISMFAGLQRPQLSKDQQYFNFKKQCTAYLDAFAKSDAKSFVSFLYPNYVKNEGGEDSLIAELTEGAENRAPGTIKLSMIDSLSIYVYNNQLQSVVTIAIENWHWDVHSTGIRIDIAVSDDGGYSWKFIPAYEYNSKRANINLSLAPEIKDILAKNKN